jgi:hypothetical protein
MAEHGTSMHYTGPSTTEALFEDRQKFWGSFMHATLGGIIFMVILLVAMATFLL